MAVAGKAVMKPTASARSKVLVLGDAPLEDSEFDVRGLKLLRINLGHLSRMAFNDARGVVIAESSTSDIAASFFRRYFRDACAAGITTLIKADGKTAAAALQLRDRALAPFNLTPEEHANLRMLVDSKSSLLAQTLLTHVPGPQIGAPRVTVFPRRKRLDDEVVGLLQRAFWDCDTLTLEELPGGKTAMQTFRAIATLRWTGGVAPQPMPFFVKIGDRRTILAERRHYKEWAEPFIPFHLRPNVCDPRVVCTLGPSALVCNFVDGASPLRQALRTDQGEGAIFSLFEVTLRGLRIQALRSTQTKGAVQTFIKERVRAVEIGKNFPERLVTAREMRPSMRDPETIEAALISRAGDMRSRWGIYHGDLHAGNVMVRRHDSIVIDFGSMQDFGPLSADPAFLEVSLAFGTDSADSADTFDEWRRFIDEIFLDGSPANPPVPSMDHFHFIWLRKALRELRHVVKCCGVSDCEMQLVLCGCMLRFARLDPSDFKDKALVSLSEKRRAYALVVADRLLQRIEGLNAES